MNKIWKFMAFAFNKIMTFLNLQSLVTDEGFSQKAVIPSTNEGVTRSEAETYLELDTSGTIGGLANNRVIRRDHLVDGAGALESIMRSALTNIEPSSCSPVTIHMKHNGSNVLPILGDRCYDTNENVLNGGNKWCSVERYPGYGHEEFIRIDTNGYVTFREWCSDETVTPTNLSSSGVDCTGFTLNWTAGGEYLNPSFRIFRDGHGDVSGVINGDATSKRISLVNGTSGTFQVRAYKDSSGTGSYKESADFTFSNPSCAFPITMSYIPLQTSPSGACSAQDSITYYHDGFADQIANGDRIYTNSSLTTPFNGNGKYFRDYDYNRAILVDSSGYVISVQSC